MKIISSFSGGKTSAYMTIKLKEKHGDDLIVIFANTGQENEETLNFVHKCDVDFNLGVVWLESKTYPKRKSSGHIIVDFASADRNGSVFENMIKKYGIPNKAYPHCTRELKLNPIKSWIKKNINDEYKMMIGIRFDESKRMSKDAEQNNLWYPLVEGGILKIDINEFWRTQTFNLGLQDYQGNCKTCFKKSNRKLLMIAKQNPEFFDFALEMEKEHGLSGHNIDGNLRVFFRDSTSAKQLLELTKTDQMDIFEFIEKIDDDENSNCSESCEAFI